MVYGVQQQGMRAFFESNEPLTLFSMWSTVTPAIGVPKSVDTRRPPFCGSLNTTSCVIM